MGQTRLITILPVLALGWVLGVSIGVCESGESAMSDAEKQQKIESLYVKYERKFPAVEGITASDLLQSLAEGEDYILVDVRKPKEQAVSMIPGALTRKEFESRSDELRGRTIVTYCTAGYRSGLFAQNIQAKGWQVLNLEGSLLAWTHAGGPLVDAEGPTQRVHVYSKDWSLEASDYEPVW